MLRVKYFMLMLNIEMKCYQTFYYSPKCPVYNILLSNCFCCLNLWIWTELGSVGVTLYTLHPPQPPFVTHFLLVNVIMFAIKTQLCLQFSCTRTTGFAKKFTKLLEKKKKKCQLTLLHHFLMFLSLATVFYLYQTYKFLWYITHC